MCQVGTHYLFGSLIMILTSITFTSTLAADHCNRWRRIKICSESTGKTVMKTSTLIRSHIFNTREMNRLDPWPILMIMVESTKWSSDASLKTRHFLCGKFICFLLFCSERCCKHSWRPLTSQVERGHISTYSKPHVDQVRQQPCRNIVATSFWTSLPSNRAVSFWQVLCAPLVSTKSSFTWGFTYCYWFWCWWHWYAGQEVSCQRTQSVPVWWACAIVQGSRYEERHRASGWASLFSRWFCQNPWLWLQKQNYSEPNAQSSQSTWATWTTRQTMWVVRALVITFWAFICSNWYPFYSCCLAPWKALARPRYIGSLQEKEEPSVKYIDYASKHTMPRRGFRPGAREEFAQLLSDTTLDSNDVQGIRKVSHIEMIWNRHIPICDLTALFLHCSWPNLHIYAQN